MKLTKRQALENTKRHWQYMADTGFSYKGQYFIDNDIYTRPSCDCYCCQYDEERGDCCNDCPLNGFAWPYDSENSSSCLREGVYADWTACDREDNSKYARLMVDACDRALAALGDYE